MIDKEDIDSKFKEIQDSVYYKEHFKGYRSKMYHIKRYLEKNGYDLDNYSAEEQYKLFMIEKVEYYEKYDKIMQDIEGDLVTKHKKNLDKAREQRAKAISLYFDISEKEAMDIIKNEQISEYIKDYDLMSSEIGDYVREEMNMQPTIRRQRELEKEGEKHTDNK
jgi:hypothetical protein